MGLRPLIVPEIRFKRKHDDNRVRLLLSRSMPLVIACTLLSFLHNYIKVDETLETQKPSRLVEQVFIVPRRATTGVTKGNNLPKGTLDDRFWAVALAVYAAEQAEPRPSRPME
jgi:hypothetical protein